MIFAHRPCISRCDQGAPAPSDMATRPATPRAQLRPHTAHPGGLLAFRLLRLTLVRFGADDRCLHNTQVMLDHLLNVVAPGSVWRARLVAHLETCPLPVVEAMGFLANWQRRQAWRVA